VILELAQQFGAGVQRVVFDDDRAET